MDSQDISAPPPHHHPNHPYLHQPPFPPHHAMLLVQHHPIQHPSNNSYPLPNSNNSFAPTTSAASNPAVIHPLNPRFPFNSVAAAAAIPKPIDHPYGPDGSPSGSGGAWGNVEPSRKKRGRPRKHSPDNSIGLGLSPAPVTQVPSGGGNVDSGGGGGTLSSETPIKRHRGRPPGSVKKQLDALGVPGVGFTPHVITVNSGEDIASTIMAFSQQGPRTVCILSANGAICNVTLRQPAISGGTVTYEGRFEIISLSGSFLLSESDDNSCALRVSLAGSDGRVLGGGVSGILKAASPVQVVVGSFIAEGKKPKGEPSPLPPSNKLNFGTPMAQESLPSPGASSDSGDENGGSPFDPISGQYANAGQAAHNVHMYWPNPAKMFTG